MPDAKSFPRALEAPGGEVALIDAGLIERAVVASQQSPRRRVILPLHGSASDPLHRMLNAVQPGSYIRPHRHLHPPKAEALVVLRGAVRFLTFDPAGAVTARLTLSARESPFGLDVRPGVYHTFLALAPDTVVFETKPGPYDERSDKEFAAWAPAEGSPDAARYLQRLADSGPRGE